MDVHLIFLFVTLLANLGSITSVKKYKSFQDNVNENVSSNKRIVCYYGNWGAYSVITPNLINPFVCTHLIYAFAKINNNNLHPVDKFIDIEKGGYDMITSLKTTNPKLKVLLSVGGYNAGPQMFKDVSRSDDTIKKFAKNAVKFLRYYNFDGLDIDWEFPLAEEKTAFTNFITNIKLVFSNERTNYGYEPLLLTAALSAFQSHINNYEVSLISECLDFINIMTYNYYGTWNRVVNHHSALYADPQDKDKMLNIDWSIKKWLEMGAPDYKINVGFALYGQSFQLANPKQVIPGSASVGRGIKGFAEEGIVEYSQMCQKVLTKNWHVVRNPFHLAPYAYQNNQWIGFDDVRSFREKANYVIMNNLGGAFVWAIQMEDFSGSCNEETYPMVKAIRSVFENFGAIEPGLFQEIFIPIPLPVPTVLSRNVAFYPIFKKQSLLYSSSPKLYDCVSPGLFVHPYDCTKYINCAENPPKVITPYEMNCPSNLVFDPKENCCNYYKVTGCITGQLFSSSQSMQKKRLPTSIKSYKQPPSSKLMWQSSQSPSRKTGRSLASISNEDLFKSPWSLTNSYSPLNRKHLFGINNDTDSSSYNTGVNTNSIVDTLAEYLSEAEDKNLYQDDYEHKDDISHQSSTMSSSLSTLNYPALWNLDSSTTEKENVQNSTKTQLLQNQSSSSSHFKELPKISPADLYQRISNPCYFIKIIPHPYICYMYLKCVTNEKGLEILKEFECPFGKEFDSTKLICVVLKRSSACGMQYRNRKIVTARYNS